MSSWHYWYLFSAALFLLEATAVPGIGFFFAAFGALSVGLLIQSQWLDAANWLAQATAFFFLTGIWTALLWVPLQKFRVKNRKNAELHHDVIGRSAIVGPDGLRKGARGQAFWSGTLMSARLADNAAIDSAASGTELKIVAIEGLTLVLAEKTYQKE
jgi:membrane protein implicated in regulation of membrane protease activity